MNKILAFVTASLMTACIATPLPAMAQQSAKKAHATSAHTYWLADGMNQLALLLPNRRAGTPAHQ